MTVNNQDWQKNTVNNQDWQKNTVNTKNWPKQQKTAKTNQSKLTPKTDQNNS